MKKLLLVAVIVAAGLTSCKKDYTCECVTSVTGADDVTTTTEWPKTKKKDAQDACDVLSNLSSATTCTLK